MAQDAVSWAEFAAAAPALASQARGQLERFGFVFVGTVRRDGAPRISAVEAHLVRERLMLVLIAGTQEATDLQP